jgi:uncharacterized protein (TIGR03000 family)
MRNYRWAIWMAPVLALVLIGMTPELSEARGSRGGGGGGRGYSGGRGYGGGYGGGYRGGYGRGWYGGPYIGLGFGDPYLGGYYGSNYGGSYYDTPVYNYSSPSYVQAPNTAYYNSAQSAAPSMTQSFYSGPPANAADINIILPANGTISFGSFQASQPAGAHVYETPSLTGDDTYGYDVQAKWTEDGKEVSRTKHVRFRAGQQVAVDFRNP